MPAVTWNGGAVSLMYLSGHYPISSSRLMCHPNQHLPPGTHNDFEGLPGKFEYHERGWWYH